MQCSLMMFQFRSLDEYLLLDIFRAEIEWFLHILTVWYVMICQDISWYFTIGTSNCIILHPNTMVLSLRSSDDGISRSMLMGGLGSVRNGSFFQKKKTLDYPQETPINNHPIPRDRFCCCRHTKVVENPWKSMKIRHLYLLFLGKTLLFHIFLYVSLGVPCVFKRVHGREAAAKSCTFLAQLPEPQRLAKFEESGVDSKIL